MARRDLLTGDERRALFGVPLDHASLAKHYTVADEDRPLIEAKRGDANRLGFALHLALLRHPRQCWAICVLPGSFCPRPPVSSGSGWRGAPWRAASRPTRWSMRLLRSR